MKNTISKDSIHSPEATLNQLNRTLEDAKSSQKSINAFSAIRTKTEIQDEVEQLFSEDKVLSNEPLAGVAVSVKDSFHVSGLPRWHGSATHPGKISEFDSAPVKRLRNAGAVIIGKTTMPDYGLIASGLSSEFGFTFNPWDNTLSPGGSSSGAAASVASTRVRHALGTDIAGSVRLPAAQCGITALKPTQGAIAYSPASTWRSAGPMTRSVSETELMFTVLTGRDASDQLSISSTAFSSNSKPEPIDNLERFKIGVVEWPGYGPKMDDATGQAFEVVLMLLQELRATLTPVNMELSITDFNALDACLQTRAIVELQNCPVDRQDKLLSIVRSWSDSAWQTSASQYYAHFEHLSSVSSRLSAQLQEYDYIVSPTLGDHHFPVDSFGPDTSQPLLYHTNYTAWFNQTGQPALTIPMGVSDKGIPIGVQVVGSRFSDFELLHVGKILEKNLAVELNYPESDLLSN